eukprot:CAMPEP_0172825080 /NCGR_PEP_ID=MMETSP1075-20121228/18425_1 /TAXON_ID=2916 /ORGANISM="Ceratium fusus, Strain PA161109" /LENGTH=66 /DNA_ID=CAMNT_0013666459 /DNA_START=71 /DNA_END=268 /DNA_ORIENTATION=-
MPGRTNWLQARQLMAHGLRPLLSKSKLEFVSPAGERLTKGDDSRTVAEIFHCDLPREADTSDVVPV